MRQDVIDRFNSILREKLGSSWKDGWVYGRLNEEFSLQPDELEWIVSHLGFKHGWNPKLKSLLEQQWREQKGVWERYQNDIDNSANAQARIRRLQATKDFYSMPATSNHPADRPLKDLTPTTVNVTLNSLEYLLLRCMVSMPRREQEKLLEQLKPYRPVD